MVGLILVWNFVVFFVYAYDKFASKKGLWRISEKALLLTAFFAGGVGAYLSMFCLRHKTRHLQFKVLVPVFAVFTAVFEIYLLGQ